MAGHAMSLRIRRVGVVFGVVFTVGLTMAAAITVMALASPSTDRTAAPLWVPQPTRAPEIANELVVEAPRSAEPTSSPSTTGAADSTSPAVPLLAVSPPVTPTRPRPTSPPAGAPGAVAAPESAADAPGSATASTPTPPASSAAPTDAAAPSGGSGPGTTTAPATSTTSPGPDPTVPVSGSGPWNVSTIGGSTTVACNAGVARAVSVSPNSGFVGEQNQNGSAIEVRFRSATHDSRVHVSCSGATPTITTSENSD